MLIQYSLTMLVIIMLAGACIGEASLKQKAIFKSGEGEYHTYRIPSLIISKGGTLLAFCEGRRHSRSDTGEINVLLRRSFDNGATWEPIQIVAADGPNTMGNPCPVVDRGSGTIWLLMTRNLGSDRERDIIAGTSEGTREVWITSSTDDGATWSPPVEITHSTKHPDWRWYATGPGIGIQTSSGRFIIPCDYSVKDTGEYGSHIIYSVDRGKTWKLGGTVFPKVNECQVLELKDGSLMLNMRSYHGRNRRAVSISRDGGMTWTEPILDEALIEPVCQASFIRYDADRLLFSNPASTTRDTMTVRVSSDEGKTWPVGRVIYEGHSAYSCLAVLPDMTIACLYERGDEHPYETITFARFTMEWLTEED